MSGVAGVVLAAGLGRRMGGPKAELVVGGQRLLDRAVAALRQAGCVPVVAVVPPGTEGDATLVVNPDAGRGLRSSLDLGLAAVPADADAVAVILVDMPGVTGEAVAQVVAHWRPGRIAVGTSGARRTHPTVMAPEQWRAALAVAGADEGARRHLQAHPELVDEVPVAVDPADLDTPEDLERWRLDSR